MGASLSWRSYDAKPGIEKVKEQYILDQESCRYENGHSYSGGIGMLDGCSNKVEEIDDFDEAIEWISQNANKWEEAKVVLTKEKEKPVYLIGGWCSE